MKEKDDKNIEIANSEDIFKKWRILEFNINNKYDFVPKGMFFTICSNILYYCIAFPILKILTKIIYDFKIEGKENIRELEKGAISISNHVLILDCAMVGLACGRKKIYYTTLESQFKIPFVRKLIKLLRAIPIPREIKNKERFLKSVNNLLEDNNIIHFYPERDLIPYCTQIRNFKNGAFELAVKNKVPIVPMVFIFRNPKGLRKIIKRKKDVTLKILSPIDISEYEGNIKEKTEELKLKVQNEMNEAII